MLKPRSPDLGAFWCLAFGYSWVYIRYRVIGFYWLRPYGASLLIERKSKQNALAPPLGASLSLGIPVIRHCCVGPPPPAIHGLRRLNRHPCRFAPRSNVEFRPAWFNGAPKIKIKSRSKTAFSPRTGRSELVRETPAQPKQASSDTPHRSLRQLLQNSGKVQHQVGCQAAALLTLISGAPLNHAGRTQILNRGQPGRTPG